MALAPHMVHGPPDHQMDVSDYGWCCCAPLSLQEVTEVPLLAQAKGAAMNPSPSPRPVYDSLIMANCVEHEVYPECSSACPLHDVALTEARAPAPSKEATPWNHFLFF